MTTVVLATKNKGKIRELQALLSGSDIKLIGMTDLDGHIEVEEDGDTFEENAVKKAREVAMATRLVSIADDSGLCVDALKGAPGVRSARFAGEGALDSQNNEKLLSMMSGIDEKKRGARFVCCMAASDPEGTVFTAFGEMEGEIATEPSGSGGFGYDPLFFLPEYGKTLAELDETEKNRISHRGRAARIIAERLPEFIRGAS